MKTPIVSVALALLATIPASLAWDYIELPLSSKQPEAEWRDGLAEWLEGEKEVRIEGGRIDVVTEEWAVEVDRPHKWHEGLGQALHYSDALDRQGVLALIAYAQGPDQLMERSRSLFALVDRQCKRNDVSLLILFPSDGHASEEILPDAGVEEGVSGRTYWLNTSGGTRHNSGCRYFKATAKGRMCTADEGAACGQCGG